MERPQVTWLPSVPNPTMNPEPGETPDQCCSRQCVIDFCLKYQIPLMLFTGIIFGFLVPFPGLFLDESVVPFGKIAVGCIFLLSGLKLNTAEICQAIKEWKGIIYGSLHSDTVCPTPILHCHFC